MSDEPNPNLAGMLRFLETIEANAVKGANQVFEQLQPEADDGVRKVFSSGVESGARMMRLLLVELLEKRGDETTKQPPSDPEEKP